MSLNVPGQSQQMYTGQLPPQSRPSVESNPIFDLKMSSQPVSMSSIMTKQNEEEQKRISEEASRKRQEEQKQKDEKQHFKLADYFVTVGIEDFH
jgi:hypothetical protein